jgi:uncharacterized protein DUF4175
MTVIERVRRTQRMLGAAAIASAIAWGLAATLLILAAVSFSSRANGRFGGDSAAREMFAALIGAVVAIALMWRSRRLVSVDRVALWIEERVPELHYALITALEQKPSAFSAGMEDVVARQEITLAALPSIRRSLSLAAAGLVAALLLLYVSPSGVLGRGGRLSGFGPFGTASEATLGSRLEGIQARITPPPYTGQRTTTLDDPSSISALTGSTITIHGRGAAAGITASVAAPLRVSDENGGWAISLSMPAKPTALALEDRRFERVIVLAPLADAPPTVALTTPVRDTTLRTPRLTVQLHATVSDDIGLADGYFEFLITTGSGEIFSARTITTPVVRFEGSRNGTLSTTLDLTSLKLVEGDIVSMRAIARDRNSLSGPGVATSDTRTIRIARAGEYDSLAIEAAAPPPIDSSAMSQRMLVIMTEKLVREQPTLARAELVKRSTEIGDMEDRIRKRVHEILTASEEEQGGAEQPDQPPPTVEEMESPDQISGSRNPDLKIAYDALWQAVRSLQIAEPTPALPPMRIALAALDRARIANRLYLRGAPPRIIVDIQRVRLTGKEKGTSSTRTPRSFADSLRMRLSAQFSAVIELIGRQPARATTELALMRVEALRSLPDFAAALGEVTDAIRAGRDATVPLLRARRVLDGPPQMTPGLPQWAGGGG